VSAASVKISRFRTKELPVASDATAVSAHSTVKGWFTWVAACH